MHPSGEESVESQALEGRLLAQRPRELDSSAQARSKCQSVRSENRPRGHARALQYDALGASQYDNGIFWIDYRSVLQVQAQGACLARSSHVVLICVALPRACDGVESGAFRAPEGRPLALTSPVAVMIDRVRAR